MFSSDKNIETIGQLIQLVKHSIGLQGEYLKLDIMEKTVRIITALLLFAAMGESIGYPASFGIIAAFYIIIFILFLVFRKSWIERPLIRFITSLLME